MIAGNRHFFGNEEYFFILLLQSFARFFVEPHGIPK